MTASSSDFPRNLPDQSIRESLHDPANLQAFLQRAVPALAPHFDCTRARLLDREFPLDDWRRRESDLPFEIPYRLETGELWALVFLLIEHQSSPDPQMPLRLLYFVVTYWDRQWRAWAQQATPRPPLRLNPVLPVVLYTGETAWESQHTLAALLAEPKELHIFAPTWQTLYWNLSDENPVDLLESGEAWLQALAVVRARGAAREDYEKIYMEALRRLEAVHSLQPVRWHDLLRLVLGWALHTRPRSERDELVTLAQASQAHVVSRLEVKSMAQTIAEALREEGREEGLEKGRLLTTREMLRTVLENRFGDLSEALTQRIETTTDLQTLKTWVTKAVKAASLNEIATEIVTGTATGGERGNEVE